MPTGGLFGTGATDFFCSAVEKGSRGLVLLLRNPALVALLLAILVGLVTFVVVRPTWTPVAPLRLGRRRTWGQILSASASMYVRHPLVFLGIGLLVIPISLVTAVLQWFALEGLDAIGFVTTGETAGGSAFLAVVVGTTLALLALGLVQAASVGALLALDAERPVHAVAAYAFAFRRIRPLLRASAVFVLAWIVLTTTLFLIPVAIWLAIRWCLLAPVATLEEDRARDVLRGSRDLVRRRWLRTASLVGLSAAIALLLGPLLGALLIFVVDAPLAVLNLVAGDRLRGGAPVRRARHRLRVLRRADAGRARAGRRRSASCRRRSSSAAHRRTTVSTSPMSFRRRPGLQLVNPAREGGRHGRRTGTKLIGLVASSRR